MAIRFGTRQFKPSWFGTVLTLVVLACFMRLGYWQVHRAEEKQALITQFALGETSTLALPGAAADAAQLPRYQRIQLTGHYDGGHQVLLDNMPSDGGKPGYRVLTPFELAQGGWVLVDRGWIPLGATRSQLPDTAVTEDTRDIIGRLDELPRPGIRMGDNIDAIAAAGWPRVMSFPRHAELEQALGRPLQPRMVLLDAAQPDGYERVWEAHFGFGPERHLGYAVQWFALAMAVLVVYLIVSFKSKASAHDDPD